MIKFVRWLPLLLALLAAPTRALAHQLDEYLQATIAGIEPKKIWLQINLTPGTNVAERVLGLIDTDHDGLISTNESAAYAELFGHDLVARLDGRTLELKLSAFNFSEPAELRTGWGIIQLEYSTTLDRLPAGPHTFSLENRHHPAVSVYLFNAAQPASGSIRITGQTRNQTQSTGEIAFDFQPPAKPSVTIHFTIFLAGTFVVVTAVVYWQPRKKKPAYK